MIGRYYKALAPLAAIAGELVTANTIHGTAAHYVYVAVAVFGFLGTLVAPANVPKPG